MLSSGGNARSPEDQHGKHGEKQTPGEKAHFAFLPNVPFFRMAILAFWFFIGRAWIYFVLQTEKFRPFF